MENYSVGKCGLVGDLRPAVSLVFEIAVIPVLSMIDRRRNAMSLGKIDIQ